MRRVAAYGGKKKDFIKQIIVNANTNNTAKKTKETEENKDDDDVLFEETADEIRTRKKQEMYVQTKMYNIELAKYMGSTPDAVHWSKYMNLILNVLKLDKKLIATFYEHGVRNEFGLRRLQLQDFQMMRLREDVREKILKWQTDRNKYIQSVARGWTRPDKEERAEMETKEIDKNDQNDQKNKRNKKNNTDKNGNGLCRRQVKSLSEWLEQTYLLHLEKGSETTHVSWNDEEEKEAEENKRRGTAASAKNTKNTDKTGKTNKQRMKYTELYHAGRDQLFYKIEQEVEEALLPGLIFLKYTFKRPPKFKILMPPSQTRIKSKQRQIKEWVTLQKIEARQALHEEEEVQQPVNNKNASATCDDNSDDGFDDEKNTNELLKEPIHHVVPNGFEIMKYYFQKIKGTEFGPMSLSTLEEIYMIMDIVKIPIGGRIVKTNEPMTYIGILFHGECKSTTPPAPDDILGVPKTELIKAGSILDDDKLFRLHKKQPSNHAKDTASRWNKIKDNVISIDPVHDPANPANLMSFATLAIEAKEETEETEEEEEEEEQKTSAETVILRSSNIEVCQNTLHNTDHAIMGVIPFEKLNLHPVLKNLLLRGCGVNVIEHLKKQLIEAGLKKSKKGKKKGKQKGKKAAAPFPKKEVVKINEDHYDDIDADEVMYRVWIHRARITMDESGNAVSPSADAIDAIDAKFLRRNQFEKKQSDAKHWDEIMIRRELNILKKFKAASTILMKEVNQSFHPLRSVIESALLVKQFSNKLVQKARDNMKVQ